ncbi:MAG: aspartyl protease family protein [Terricaulis sp.]
MAEAECIAAPDLAAYQTATPTDFAMGPTRSDRLGRVVAPVTVNGQGPFRFIVDTGANRSVLSQTLADRLGVAASRTGEVHSVYGVSTAPLANIASLEYGRLELGGGEMPLLQGAVLAGEHGLLGVDGMRGRRLRMDFVRNCIEIVPSEQARRLRGWVTIRSELRFGHLVVAPGRIDGVRVNLLLDTGSDSTLANVALREAISARVRRLRTENTVAFTAGRPVVLSDGIFIPHMMMGDVEVRNVAAYVGDFHIFALWRLQDEPTLLIGMDVLAQTRGLAIDYGRSVVYLDIRDPVRTGSRLPGVQAGPSTTVERR